MHNFADNIINLNAVKKKIYDNFNFFEHNTPPTTDPILQRNILVAILAHTPELSCAERDILACIASNTACRSYYYTFMSQEEIAAETGRHRVTVARAMKRLQELEWIKYARTNKQRRKNITDFNVDKAMALGGKKGRYSKKTDYNEKSHCSETLQPNTKEDSKGSSKEEPYRTDFRSMEQEILERAKQKPKKPRMTGHSLSRTWRCAASEYDCTKVQSTLSPTDKLKLGKLTGDSRCKGKWLGSAAELHEMTHFCVKNWDYCYRWFKTAKMPKTPSVGWYVSCFDTFWEIWLTNNPDNVIDMERFKKFDKPKKVSPYKKFTAKVFGNKK